MNKLSQRGHALAALIQQAVPKFVLDISAIVAAYLEAFVPLDSLKFQHDVAGPLVFVSTDGMHASQSNRIDKWNSVVTTPFQMQPDSPPLFFEVIIQANSRMLMSIMPLLRNGDVCSELGVCPDGINVDSDASCSAYVHKTPLKGEDARVGVLVDANVGCVAYFEGTGALTRAHKSDYCSPSGHLFPDGGCPAVLVVSFNPTQYDSSAVKLVCPPIGQPTQAQLDDFAIMQASAKENRATPTKESQRKDLSKTARRL